MAGEASIHVSAHTEDGAEATLLDWYDYSVKLPAAAWAGTVTEDEEGFVQYEVSLEDLQAKGVKTLRITVHRSSHPGERGGRPSTRPRVET